MSSSILIITTSAALVIAQSALIALILKQYARKQQAAIEHAARSVARLRHELAMDAAVFVAGLKATEAATTWVRGHVDPGASQSLAESLGADGYERYLIELHRRYVGR